MVSTPVHDGASPQNEDAKRHEPASETNATAAGDDTTLEVGGDDHDNDHDDKARNLEPVNSRATGDGKPELSGTGRALARAMSRTGDEDLEKGPASQAQAKSEAGTDAPQDPNIVGWDGPDDPEDPYNWPTWRKVVNCGLISALTFLTPLASSIFAPGVPQLMQEFNSDSSTLASFVVSVYVLGFAAGPLLCAPLSEIYGRTIVYHVCNFGFICFTVACALAPSLDALIGFRFLAGLFGSAPLTNGGGTIADMIRQEKRGAAMAAFSIGPLLGPIIGPVGGGFLADAAGWRWVFWLVVIAAGVVSIAMLFFLRETYAMVLLERKTAKLRKETGNTALRSKLDPGLSSLDFFKRGIIRPLKMLAFSPICIIFAAYIAVVYGYLYLMFTSLTTVFMRYYNFSAGTAGLSFMGMGVGSMMGLAFFSVFSDRYLKSKAAKADAEAEAQGKQREGMKPEYRLVTLPTGTALLAVGLFWYGWSADEGRAHWIVPILGTAVVGIGNLVIFLAINMYLVDAFSMYAASALAANAVARSVAGAFLPMAGLPMYDALGIGWGNSLLGFIAVAMFPICLLIIKYGEFLRKKYQVKNL